MTEHLIDKAITYLQNRQCANGGFCFYKMEYLEEPNAKDTFFAITSFLTVKQQIPQREKIINYLRQEFSQQSRNLNTLYFSLYTLHLMGYSWADEDGKKVINDMNISLPINFDGEDREEKMKSLLRAVRLKKLLGELGSQKAIIDLILSQKQSTGGFGENPNLQETYWCLAILKEVGYDFQEMESTRNFLERLQRKETGFTNTENGINSSLDILYAGVGACDILQQEIHYIDATLGFVKMCQMEKGGFARMPIGLPTIENTYRALKIIDRLQQFS